MNVIKPRSLGIVTKICRDPPKTFLAIGVLGFFDFEHPQAFLHDTEMWPFLKAALPENTPLDAGMPKVRGEVLVFGKAMPKDGAAVPAMAIEFSLGPIRKRAIVFGDRYWRLGTVGLHPTAPKPFIEMPIDYTHAFGGEGYAKNPLGKGFAAAHRTRAGELVALPNIEMPERPITSAADEPEPYGFGPLDVGWPQRASKAGSFGQNWIRTRFPAPPADQDPTINNAAPADQWTQTWFTGDEAFTCTGMHRDYDGYSGRLPGMRARGFIRQTRPGAEEMLLEVALHAETVFLFPSELKGVVLYRGLAPAMDASGRDITDLMIAYERLSDEPRSHPYYAEVFALRTDPETKGLHAMNDLQLSPALSPEVRAERDAEREEYVAAELAKQQRRSDRQYEGIMAKMGMPLARDAPRPKVLPSPFPVVTPAEIARGEVNLAGIVGTAKRLIAEVQQRPASVSSQGIAELTALRAQSAANAGVPQVTGHGAEQALTDMAQQQAQLGARGSPAAQQAAAKIGEALAAARAQLTPEALALYAAGPADEVPAAAHIAAATESLRGQLVGLAGHLRGGLAGASGGDQSKLMQAIWVIEGAIGSHAPGAATDAATAPAATPAASPAALATEHGNQLISALDTAAAHFPADLQPEVFARVTEAKAGWSAAMRHLPALTPPAGPAIQLPRLSLPAPSAAAGAEAPPRTPDGAAPPLPTLEAKSASALGEARQQIRLASPEPLAPTEALSAEQSRQLREEAQAVAASGASLAGRDFAGADLSGLNFSGLDLTGAMFEQADLTGADFSYTTLTSAVFTAATLRNARFDYANLQDANLCRVKAEAASLTHADFSRALLLYACFVKADLSGARFDSNMLIEAHLDGAVLRQSHWEMCSIVNATLNGADFSGAHMRLCSFMRSDLSGLIAKAATLFRVGITDCPADAADFSESTLMRMAAAGGSTFRNSLFRRVHANRSTWFKVDLSGADFNRAELDQAFLGESTAVQASFYRASLRNACLIGTDFTDADLAEANLFRALLRNATLDRAELRYASLYGAITGGVSWQLCDLTRVNLRLTEFTRG